MLGLMVVGMLEFTSHLGLCIFYHGLTLASTFFLGVRLIAVNVITFFLLELVQNWL